ncbi:hypothetical protein K432DRAFT_292914 [Lepidopterella palustris CBS 459.81]|uniref:Ankyrin n=1 Tax=Lepidopterella palustris CBS 459.81 TaxID=1314670 RepID=A0A8E2JHF2_9PEZI|nr:hypothetical protein K432DRAFT_292914 [Lepidopterella palustris CBS 459.81]
MRKKAVKTEDFRIVKMLLERVVNLSIQKVEGGAPIHYATFNGNGVVVKHLIDNEADLNFRAQSYCVLSPWKRRADVLATLLIHGSDPDLMTREGATEMDLVESNRHLDVIELLGGLIEDKNVRR